MQNIIKKVLSLTVLVVSLTGTFMAFIGIVIVNDPVYNTVYIILCILFMIFSGIGVFWFTGRLSIRRIAAWIALLAGMIMIGFGLYHYARDESLHSKPWIYVVPFPCFSLISWGGYYLGGSVRIIKELKTPPEYIWGYCGLLGGSIMMIALDPIGRFVFHEGGSVIKIIMYVAIIILETALPLYWFLKVKGGHKN